ATGDLSEAMEGSRIRMSVAQFGDLGLIIKKYAASPESIEKFFDLESIRYSSQTKFNGTLNPEETEFIAKRSFGDTDQILLKNTGDSKLRFYLAQTKELGPGTVFVELNKGEQTVAASALGNTENTFLKVFNTDPLVPGSYTIKIL
ncbi:MAG TPA: hypothetical protein VHO90_21695, partial [Bacteroidales bacterium]|nr:hypothetical protein [Bacteroidales bacterium]